MVLIVFATMNSVAGRQTSFRRSVPSDISLDINKRNTTVEYSSLPASSGRGLQNTTNTTNTTGTNTNSSSGTDTTTL